MASNMILAMTIQLRHPSGGWGPIYLYIIKPNGMLAFAGMTGLSKRYGTDAPSYR